MWEPQIECLQKEWGKIDEKRALYIVLGENIFKRGKVKKSKMVKDEIEGKQVQSRQEIEFLRSQNLKSSQKQSKKDQNMYIFSSMGGRSFKKEEEVHGIKIRSYPTTNYQFVSSV